MSGFGFGDILEEIWEGKENRVKRHWPTANDNLMGIPHLWQFSASLSIGGEGRAANQGPPKRGPSIKQELLSMGAHLCT